MPPSPLWSGYDAQGNLANKDGQTYAFGRNNRLYTTPGKESYRYDAQGHRTLQNASAGNILSQYTQDGQLMQITDNRSGFTTSYVSLGGSLVAARKRAISGGAITVEYQHTDALGTPVAVTDSSRTVIERSEYEPYGQLLNRAQHDGPGFTGPVQDALTGLTYMQQRYYDPSIGAMLSVDPVTAYEKPLTNFCRYCYARNNPYKFTDPDGRDGANFYTDPNLVMPAPSSYEGVGVIADFLPVIGDIKGFVDAYNDPSFTNVAAAVVGLVPEIGDVAGKGIKALGKEVAVAERAKNVARGIPESQLGPSG